MHALPPTKLRCAAIRPCEVGKRAVDAGVDDRDLDRREVVGGDGHASKAWSAARYHCFAGVGFVGANAAAGAAAASAATTAPSSAAFVFVLTGSR